MQVAYELYDLTNCTICFRHGGELSSMMIMVVMSNDHSAVMQANDLVTTVHRFVLLYLEHCSVRERVTMT